MTETEEIVPSPETHTLWLWHLGSPKTEVNDGQVQVTGCWMGQSRTRGREEDTFNYRSNATCI